MQLEKQVPLISRIRDDLAFVRSSSDSSSAYDWHLDERPLRNDKEINPDVLGYIFEKYVNQKQMGAYYTKEDITGYIARNTVIPRLFDLARKASASHRVPNLASAMWRTAQPETQTATSTRPVRKKALSASFRARGHRRWSCTT